MAATKQNYKSKLLKPKNITIIAILLAVLIVLLTFGLLRDSDTLLTHEQANALYTDNKIEKLIIDGDLIRIKTADNQYKIYKEAINQTAFFEKYPVEVAEDNRYIFDILTLLLLGFALWFFYRQIQQNRLQHLNHMRASSKEDESLSTAPIQAITSKVTFDDVAGIKDVKEELEEIIDFLKEPKKYRDLGIRLPKGVLLVGPPGVGKTLISKAVAGEAGVPFFYQSGASFVHIYVGMGAKRVSELFNKAKQMAPSIIFIDEIDAVGKSRGEFRNDEREATLNQLLTEMDGFEDSSGVIIIGATNKVEVLDEALLRAGRFDRRIHISLPDVEDRAKTLELYLNNKPNEVNIKEVAQMTIGFNSAALDTLTNEAAIYAMRENRRMIETTDFEEVKEKVLRGKRKIHALNSKEREIQSVYQAAKAMVATWIGIEFDKIGIVNTQLQIQESEILSKSQLLLRVKVYLAGTIATRKRYNEQFTNAASDIAQAKEMVAKVIYEYAMGDNFTISAEQEKLLLDESIEELTILLETLDTAITKTSEHLIEHENITLEECKDILREIF
jgi:ATP-dependent metalloprotease FtsH